MDQPPKAKGFTKGDPRINRKGRPKVAKSIPDNLRKIGAASIPTSLRPALHAWVGSSPNLLITLLRRVYLSAIGGDMEAVKFIAERTEGKVKDVLQMEDPALKPENQLTDDELAAIIAKRSTRA